MSLERPHAAALPATPYAQVVVGQGSRLVFVSGQISVDAQGDVVAEGDLAGQLRQTHANLVAALGAAGAGVADIAKMTTYVVGYTPAMLPAIRESRVEMFGGEQTSTSTLIGVQALARPEFLVEVEAWAVVG